MKIDHLILGSYETNSYIVRGDDNSSKCAIIDTGLESDALMDFLVRQQLHPVAVILTHGHADHIAGVQLLRDRFPDIEIYIHKGDARMLTDPQANLSILSGMNFTTDPAQIILEDNQEIELADIKLKVIHTPGHTPGGISLYSQEDGIAFVGDTLFLDSVGRTDFPGGSMHQLIKSIKEKLFTLPDETICYPGHGPATTIAKEKLHNPFLR